MSLDLINKKTYENRRTALHYAHQRLQPVEITIFSRYKNSICSKTLLDVGCGAGRTTPYLTSLSTNYIGIDYSLAMIRLCRSRFPDIQFLHCDVRDMSVFGDHTFDFVLFAFNGLDYIGHEDRIRALREIHRVLRRGGIFVFSSHNRNCRSVVSSPRLRLARNPWTQGKNMAKFLLSAYNHRRNKNYEHFERKYAIINDEAEWFSLLTYYIDKKLQTAQLCDVGFAVTEMYDTRCKRLESDDDDADSGWVYYVARRQ